MSQRERGRDALPPLPPRGGGGREGGWSGGGRKRGEGGGVVVLQLSSEMRIKESKDRGRKRGGEKKDPTFGKRGENRGKKRRKRKGEKGKGKKTLRTLILSDHIRAPPRRSRRSAGEREEKEERGRQLSCLAVAATQKRSKGTHDERRGKRGRDGALALAFFRRRGKEMKTRTSRAGTRREEEKDKPYFSCSGSKPKAQLETAGKEKNKEGRGGGGERFPPSTSSEM